MVAEKAEGGHHRVINRTRGTELVRALEIADSPSKRSKGLLGRKGLEKGTGLWIVPCESVHMFGMKFAIDLVYLDRRMRVRKIRRGLKPWRISACLTAHSVIELPVGAIEESGTQSGDILEMVVEKDTDRFEMTQKWQSIAPSCHEYANRPFAQRCIQQFTKAEALLKQIVSF